MAHMLHIQSPKENIDGGMVRKVYCEDKYLDRIILYCERDLMTVVQVFLRLRNDELLTRNKSFIFRMIPPDNPAF